MLSVLSPLSIPASPRRDSGVGAGADATGAATAVCMIVIIYPVKV